MEDKISIVKEKKGSVLSAILVNKEIILAAVVYFCGLFMGSYFYRISDSKMLDKLLEINSKSVINMMAENICVYLSVFLIAVFLGLCLIGYPLINIIPVIIGVASGLKMSYLYVNNSTKGVAYALIMVAPFLSVFSTVIAYAIQESNLLSKNLIIAVKDKESIDINLSDYLKKMLKLGAVLLLAALISALIKSLLSGIVTI